jgi:hypothetical protein
VTAALDDAAARGIVGIVDLDMAWNADAWRRRLDAGFDAARVRFGIYPAQLDRALAEGWRRATRWIGRGSSASGR